jgi:hypothetical protein
VGNTLTVRRSAAGLELTWGDVGADSYNVHLVPLGGDLSAFPSTPPERNAAGATVTLDSGQALPGAGTIFLQVYSATSCGRSIP